MSCNSQGNCYERSRRGELGSQSCITHECISVSKVYDWVIHPSSEQTKVQLPEDCREKVEALCREGVMLDVEVKGFALSPYVPIEEACHKDCHTCKIVKIDRTTIDVDCQQVEVAVACITYSVEIEIIIKRAHHCCHVDACSEGSHHSDVVCCFKTCVPLWDRVVLCLPSPLDSSNIRTRIVEVDVDCAGIIMGGCLDLSLFVCKEVQVEAPVKLEVLGRFCQPRGPIPLPDVDKKRCLPLVRFPKQCPAIFPISRCECQAIACATVEDQEVVFDCINGMFPEVGTLFLNADICPENNPNGSFVIFKFDDAGDDGAYYYSGDQSFAFEAQAGDIGAPECGRTSDGRVRVTVKGRGTFCGVSPQTRETVQFTLAFEGRAGARTGSYRFTIDNGVECLFDSEVVDVTRADGALTVRACDFDSLPVVSPISDLL